MVSGSILWVGDSGSPRDNEVFSHAPLGTDYGAYNMTTFTTSLNAHTLCEWRQYGQCYYGTNIVSPPGVGANVDHKAQIYYRDPDDLRVYQFSYPAPIPADIESTSVGKRIKQSAVVTIVGYLSTLMNKSYIPLYGVYYEKV